jgi:GNAT superfamily N-acetyltransferase
MALTRFVSTRLTLFSLTQGPPAPVAHVYVGVAPEWRGRGIGTRLFELAAGHAATLGATGLHTALDHGDAASARFVAARGFRHTRDLQSWSLDLGGVSLAELPARQTAAEGAGLRLVPIRELMDRPEDLYRLHVEIARDIPADVPIESTYQTWRIREFDTPLFDPDASFCILDGANPVALTWMFVDLAGRRAGHGITGTLPAYRHRGLARLAKLASLAWLADHDVAVVYTDNDTTNRDMLVLNEHLGFRPLVVIELWVREGPATAG